MDAIHFEKRTLFLSTDQGLVARQIGGEDIDLAQAGSLRDDVSTDEITPLPPSPALSRPMPRRCASSGSAGASTPPSKTG